MQNYTFPTRNNHIYHFFLRKPFVVSFFFPNFGDANIII